MQEGVNKLHQRFEDAEKATREVSQRKEDDAKVAQQTKVGLEARINKLLQKVKDVNQAADKMYLGELDTCVLTH